MKKINIDWVRLAKAAGFTLGFVAAVTAIVLLGKYAPWLLLAIIICIFIGIAYSLIAIWED